jgi:butyryl-CoA dehydrogenase
MEFELTEAANAARRRALSLITDVLPALPSAPVDFARAAHLAAGECGLFRLDDTVSAVRSVAELARASASLGAVAASGWLFAEALRRDGGVERSTLASAASDGSVIGCLAFADPRRRRELRAVPASGGYRLEGAVELVANAPIAAHALVILAGEESSLIVAHLGGAAFEAVRGPPAMGIGFSRLPRSSLDLTGVMVEAASVLGPGTTIGKDLVDLRRILTAALALGLAERGTARAIAHVRAERARPPQSTEFLLADLATDLEAATLSVTRAAWLRDTRAPHTLESAAGKLLATRAATRALHGALGVIGEEKDTSDLRRAYLDARGLEMQDGAQAGQQDTIASVMLGER